MSTTDVITEPNRQPIIAVFADWGSVSSAFKTFGARVVQLDSSWKLEETLENVDAIALTGGGDVNPARYGAKPHRQNYGTSDDRDDREFAAVAYAQAHGMPMFGICRGLQLLNVAHGGSLDQHIGDNNEAFSHEGTDHFIKLRRGSRFARHTGLVGLRGTHLHHQRIARLGNGLVPTGWAHDGTIEFIENAPGTSSIVVATQFHPEMDYFSDDDAGLIFAHFVRLASAHMKPDVMGRWKKVKPRPTALMTYGNPTQGKGVVVKGTDGVWRREYPTSTTITTYGRDYDEEDDEQRYENWWNDKRYMNAEDEEDFETWAALNGIRVPIEGEYEEDDKDQRTCDARCAFPPCTDVAECTHYNDCMAETVAIRTAAMEEYQRAVEDQKRGNGRH